MPVLRPLCGGCTFAEDPDVPAPAARVIWHAAFDPDTLPVSARPSTLADPEAVVLEHLAPWLSIATGDDGREHAVLSDGRHHIRLDIEAGRIGDELAVRLFYQLQGLAAAKALMDPLKRFLALCQRRAFPSALFPDDPRVARGIDMLRVHDALVQGASQRDMAVALFGEERVYGDWAGTSDSLRSRVRRLVREARTMARGGYREMLRRR